MGGFGIWELLIVLLIVALLFGTKKLRSLGGDIGSAVKGFRSAVKDNDEEQGDSSTAETNVIESETEQPSKKDSSEN